MRTTFTSLNPDLTDYKLTECIHEAMTRKENVQTWSRAI